VGCAINSASDITVGAAGIVLIKDDLVDVLNAILIARKSFQRIKINFVFAFMYNVCLIPVAMGVFYPINKFKLDPMFAAIAMAMSSISVVTSSLLLKLYRPNLKVTNENHKVSPSQGGLSTGDSSSYQITEEPIKIDSFKLKD
jgi:Cu+-exporting ATPase